jgi:hypothetical protein
VVLGDRVALRRRVDDAARGHEHDPAHAGGLSGLDDVLDALVVGVEEYLLDAVEGGNKTGGVGEVRGVHVDAVGKLARFRQSGGCTNGDAATDQVVKDEFADASAGTCFPAQPGTGVGAI